MFSHCAILVHSCISYSPFSLCLERHCAVVILPSPLTFVLPCCPHPRWDSTGGKEDAVYGHHGARGP